MPTTVYTPVKLPPEQRAAVERMAEQRGITVSEVVRWAIALAVEGKAPAREPAVKKNESFAAVSEAREALQTN